MIARVADFGVYKTSIAIHFIPQDTRSRVYLYVRAIFLSLFFLFLQPRNARNQIELSPTEFTNDVGTITFLFICRHFFWGGKKDGNLYLSQSCIHDVDINSLQIRVFKEWKKINMNNS